MNGSHLLPVQGKVTSMLIIFDLFYSNYETVFVANTDNVFLSGVTDIDGVPTYKLEDEDRAQTVTCMAYNGSQPVMTLFINAVEIKDL